MLRVRSPFRVLGNLGHWRNFSSRKPKIREELPVQEHSERTGLPVIAILGRPNVGKSTLFNCFVRLFSGKFQNSAIVTKIPGTTRDRIHAFLEIPDTDGLPVSKCMVSGY